MPPSKSFTKTGTRPDLMAVVAIGDLEVDEMEQMIKDKFGEIPAAQNPRERELFEVPDHDGR